MDTHYYICNAIALMAYTTSCQPEKQHTQSENQEKKFKNLLTKEKNSYICIVPREVKDHGNMLHSREHPSCVVTNGGTHTYKGVFRTLWF